MSEEIRDIPLDQDQQNAVEQPVPNYNYPPPPSQYGNQPDRKSEEINSDKNQQESSNQPENENNQNEFNYNYNEEVEEQKQEIQFESNEPEMKQTSMFTPTPTLEENQQVILSEEKIESRKGFVVQDVYNNQSEQLEFEIKVYVIDPLVKDGLQQFIVYAIKGEDKDGPFDALRRYSDFDHLRSNLVSRWPACYVPMIPKKKAVGNMDSKFIQGRRVKLNDFLTNLCKLKHLWYSEETRIFLRSTSSDLEKAYKALPKLSANDLITKYEKCFMKLSGKEINSELIVKIKSFSEYIKRITTFLENYRQMTKNIIENRQTYNQNMQQFFTFLMPQYQEHCLREYINDQREKNVFFGKEVPLESKWKEMMQKCEFKHLKKLFKDEQQDIMACLEAIETQNYWETLKNQTFDQMNQLVLDQNQVSTGKNTMKTLFSKNSKDDNIQMYQTQIDMTKLEIERLSLLSDILTVVFGYDEIDRFKKSKEDLYYRVVRQFAQFEFEYSQLHTQYWQIIASHPSLCLE